LSLEEFIRTSLVSVDDLRVLLLFHGAPNAGMDVSEVAGKLYMSPATAAEVAGRLTARGLLADAGGERPRFRYQPASTDIAQMVEELVKLDRERPVSLINMIYPSTRDIRAFAAAFRIIKDKEK